MRHLGTKTVLISVVAALASVPAANAQQPEYEEEALEPEYEEELAPAERDLQEQVEEVLEPPPEPGVRPPTRASAYSASTWPTRYVIRPLTMSRGMLELTGSLVISFSADNIFEPVSIAPDVYFGITDDLTVGVTHSAMALSLTGAGTGICLSGRSRGCPDVYNNLNVELRYQLPEFGRVDLVLQGGFLIQDFDPFASMLRLGGFIRWTTGSLQILTNPWIGIALTERDTNSSIVNIPVQGAFQFTPRLAAFVGTGLNGTVEDAKDFFLIPLNFGVLYAISNQLDVGLTFGFPGLAGSDIATPDERALSLFVTYRLQTFD